MEEQKKQQIREIIDYKIRPRTRVDGGDVKFEKIEGEIIYVGAYGDCAGCSCCEPELVVWIQRQLLKELGLELRVVVNKYLPYYA